MGKEVLKDVVVLVKPPGSAVVDLSDHFSECTIEQTSDEVDFTGFTASGYREFGQGMKDAEITLTAFQDFAGTSQVDGQFGPWYNGGSAGTIQIIPHQGSITSTNPSFTMAARVFTWNSLAGGVGDASTTPVSVRNAGTLGLVKGTVEAGGGASGVGRLT